MATVLKAYLWGHAMYPTNYYVIYGWPLIAYGAAKDRSLGIPGEDSKNVISARNFVGYYNGLPEDIDLDFSLDTDHAVIVGLGNVAIDVAR